MMVLAQQTYVPDDNFETYLENNGMGDGIALNDYVYTSAIDTVTILYVSNQSISNLTGIEAFTALTSLNCEQNQLASLDVSANTALVELDCSGNQITFLNLSQNTALTHLYCSENQITFLDLSQNTALTHLSCSENQITFLDLSQNTALSYLECWVNQLASLDLSNNTALTTLYCEQNQLTSIDVSNSIYLDAFSCINNLLTSLDVSANTALTILVCNSNQLTSLDLRNGNNNNLTWFSCDDNFSLNCINVDDVAWSTTNLWSIDPQHYFSTNCSPLSIQEQYSNKELLKASDLLGRETKQTNQLLFYIYDDGTVEKKIIID